MNTVLETEGKDRAETQKQRERKERTYKKNVLQEERWINKDIN